ncbi:hypothetical protein ACFLRF_01120 [Candidatus Altiarchaeota archaeon]
MDSPASSSSALDVLTSTTISGYFRECERSSDCGNETAYLKCSNNKVTRFFDIPLCKFRRNGSYCVIITKYEVVEPCGSNEVCTNEECVRSTSTTTLPKIWTTTTHTIKIPTTTTSSTLPSCTFCYCQVVANSDSDCSNLICRKGDCVFVKSGDGGHCKCEY